MRGSVFTVGLLLLLGGCDPGQGVVSGTTLSSPVDVGCVGTAIASVPEAGRVTYHSDESRSTDDGSDPRRREIEHVWLYATDNQLILRMIETPDGWEFTNSHGRVRSRGAKQEIARFARLLQTVNGAIQERCGLPVGNLETETI
jgi:hypothetical protein